MCSTTTKTILANVVNEFISDGKMFTAFNVSLEAKSRGATERHRDMKSEINSLYRNDAMDHYTRTLIDIPGISEKAWLYHDVLDDPDDFVPLPRTTLAASVPIPISWTTTSGASIYGSVPVPAQTGTNDKVYIVESREKRLCIPKKFISELGVCPGELVYVNAVDDQIEINSSPPLNSLSVPLVVDTRGTVRLSQQTLGLADIEGTNYNINWDDADNSIRVKPA